MAAPSVFNFWRPGYSPPNSRLGSLNLVAPEFQVTDPVSTAGYINTMQGAIGNGLGSANDVQSPYANEVAVAGDAGALTDRINLLMLYGVMSPALRAHIVAAVSAITVPAASAGTTAVNTALLNRAKLSVFIAMASPEFLAQR